MEITVKCEACGTYNYVLVADAEDSHYMEKFSCMCGNTGEVP